MANAEQLAKLREGVIAWNKWREFTEDKIDLGDADLRSADISGADLTDANLFCAKLNDADLRCADLSDTYLSDANLRRAILRGAHLRGAELRGANFREANLCGADLSGADLTGAHLRGADLRSANFSYVTLSSADLSGATFFRTVFGHPNLTTCQGLDQCRHDGPSVLDHVTIVRSGTLPPSFLRGCGLPETLITYLPSLLNQSIQFYSCFISYSTKDQAFADRLYADLQNKGVRCWFAPHDMEAGKKIHEQIDDAIRTHEKLLLILSKNSIDSEWVKEEVAKARRREMREERRMLFPLSLVDFQTLEDWEFPDGDIGKDSAREIREYFIPDFSTWDKNHDAYTEAFDRLLEALKANDAAKSHGA